MIEKWSSEMDEFIKERQFQSIDKTIEEFRGKFHLFLGRKELNRRYLKLYKKKHKSNKIRVRADSFLARGIRYRYTINKYCGGYVGTLRRLPYTTHFAEDRVTLKVELRAIMLKHLKDMDILIDGKLCPKIRIDWVDTKLTLRALAKKYGVSRDTIYGVICGDIHPDPKFLRYEMHRVRRIRGLKIEVFEGEAPRGYREWAADPRSMVSWGVVYSRYQRGVRGPKLLDAVSEKSGEQYYLIEGEYKSIKGWSEDERCEVPYNCVRKRIRMGWDLNLKILKKGKYTKRFTYKTQTGLNNNNPTSK